MHLKIAILEDNADRVAAMRAWLADRFPMYDVVVFDHARSMIEWLRLHAIEVLACALDHDLEMLPGEDGQWIDPGTGRDVADYLMEQLPSFPIVVHSTNVPAAIGMADALREHAWVVERITPYDDLTWIVESWGPAVRSAIVQNALYVVPHART